MITCLLTLALIGCSPLGGTSAPPLPPVPTATPAPTAEDYAAKIVQGMTLEDKLGQMIIMQFYEPTYTAAQQAMVKPHPGGVILYGYSMGTASQVKTLLASGQKDSSIPMFTVLDLEGGLVDRLAQYLGARKSAPDIAASGSVDVARQEGSKTGQDLLSFGFNTDLAPDVDVALINGPDQYGRTFGKTPDPVITYSSAWLDGLQRTGVVGVAKHFPGLGASTVDAHKGLPVINRTKDQLDQVELAPYRALIQSGQLQMVMTTDLLVPSVDAKTPAELSKPVVTGILRDELKFQGVIVTDALYMDGISATYSFTQAAVLAFKAGNDMIMAPWRPSMITSIITAMKAELTAGRITQEQIDQSVTRILALKIRMGILKADGYTPAFTSGIGDPSKAAAGTASAAPTATP
jgi:beta-N-acetylhexosaminidase